MEKEMIDDREIIAGLALLSTELREEFMRIGALVSNQQAAEAENDLKAVLSRYDDKETGLFRSMLADVLILQGNISGAKTLLRQMSDEPAARNLGLLGQARILWNETGDEKKVTDLLKEIKNPVKNQYTDVFYLLTGMAAETGRIEVIPDLIEKGLNDIKTFQISESAEQFFAFQLFSRSLTIFSETADDILYAECASRLGEYLCTHQPTEDGETALSSLIGEQVENSLAEEPFRRSLTNLLDDAANAGWFKDNPEFLRDSRALIENADLADDRNQDFVMTEFIVSTHTQDQDIGPEEKERLRWMAAKRYLDHPESLAYIEQTYPNLYDLCREDCRPIKENPEKEMDYALQAYMEETGVKDAAAAESILQRFYDSYSYDVNLTMDLDLSAYPESVRNDVIRAVTNDVTLNLHEAADAAEDVNFVLAKPDEKMLLIILDSYLEYESPKQIREVLRTMEKQYPGSARTLLARGMNLLAEKKYKAAEKQLASLIPGDTELFRLFSNYLEAADACGKDGQVRSAVLSQLSYMKEHPLPYHADQCFERYAPLLMAIADVRRKDEKHLTEDLDLLKQGIQTKPLDLLEESRTAYWITRFCTEALESQLPGAGDAFLDLIRWCDTNHVFANQDTLIESGYSSYESYAAYRREDTDEDLYDLIAMLNGNPDDGVDSAHLAEAFWRCAEKLRRDPELYERFKQSYPHFAAGAANDIAVILENPEGAKQEAEQFLADLEGCDPMDIRARMNFSMGIFHDDDHPRFS